MPKRENQTKLTMFINNLTFNNIYNRLKLIALSMFEWEGFPNSCNTRFLERHLFEDGRVVFFDKTELGQIFSMVSDNNSYNHYGEPTGYIAHSVSFHEELNPDECVIIRNNIESIPTREIIEEFSYRLWELQRSIDVNIKAQKTPILLSCDESQRLTIKNLYMKYEGNEPVIYGDKNLTKQIDEKFKVLKTDAPFVADDLIKCKHEIMNECLSFLGLNNANTDKKERMITDEVNANNEMIEMFLWVMLSTRMEACKEIKEKFGIDVKVKVRQFKKDGEENEQVHNTTSLSD